jgi:pSer/pThr/pTyr-binding forkhead associated (FHA) protein/NADPH-dependent 2,4-dienoyl-CoA reductase/sulfur reductase-like enzyme
MTTYAIIGDGATGTTAAFYIRRTDPDARIALYSDESTPAYYRAALTNYLMGELRPEQLFAVPQNFYSDFRVERFLTRVVGVNGPGHTLRLSDGNEHPFDRLLIASGARARPPSFPGADLGGIMTMRTMQDARFIMDEVQSGRLKKAVIVGGGILGLELVAGLRARDVEATYVIRGERLMPTLLDRVASDLVLSRCRHFDVDVRADDEIAEARAGKDGYFRAATLKNSGAEVGGDLMVVAIGIDPNVEFLQGSGITINRGIPVDERMRTNVDGVFAGGDVVEIQDPRVGRMITLGLWEPARHHGRIAGINMTGGSALWKLPVPYNATRLYDLDLAAIGESIEQPGDDIELDFPQTGRSIVYKKLVLRGNKLVGALLLGHRREHVRERGARFRQLIASNVDVGRVRSKLLDPLFDLNAWMESLRTEGVRAHDVGVAQSARSDISKIIGRPVPSLGSSPDERDGATGEQPRPSLSGLMRSPFRAAAESVGPQIEPGVSPTGPAVGESPALKLPDGSIQPLDKENFVIGRSPESDVILVDERASAEHAEIRRGGEEIFISDLGSRNGTFVNENLVAMPRPLAHGDVIRIGSSQLTFFNQVLPPRAHTGPVGLPDEPLQHPGGGEVRGQLLWGDRSVEIGHAPAKIGRDPIETIVTLDDNSVSWIHAEVSWHDGDHYLRDLGSRNGTFVNGELIAIPRPLRSGDLIHVGNTDLTFEAVGSSTAPAPAVPKTSSTESKNAGLVGTARPMLGVWFALRDSGSTLGRDSACEVQLEDLTVSRRHATLDQSGGEWVIRDIGSTNGTWVNDERVPPHEVRRVALGDSVRIGRLEFRLGVLPEQPVFAPEPTAGQADIPRQATTVMDASELLGRDSHSTDEKESSEGFFLTVIGGPRSGQRIEITELPVVIGREEGPGIVGIEDEYISAQHLEIRRGSGGLEAVDLGSSNGTWVDDDPLQPNSPRSIQGGTKLRLGPATVLVLEA